MIDRDIRVQRWTNRNELGEGGGDGIAITASGARIAHPTGRITRTETFLKSTRDYEYATWTSPYVDSEFPIATVVGSFTASTPGRTWVEMSVRGRTNDGDTTKWYGLGQWAADDIEISRTSVKGQRDEHGDVVTDVFTAAEGHEWRTWQLRFRLHRPVGSPDTPVLHSIGAVTSGRYDPETDSPSTPVRALGTTLTVPTYSQKVHKGRYPQWDNGGEAWCSPASVSMVLSYWNTGPGPSDYAWIAPTYDDPQIAYAARNTYDHSFAGCGNWTFNTAYAGRWGLDAFVTRLRSLNEVEAFIDAGIPLVLSTAFRDGDVPGADYSTRGHLLLVVGFTEDGDPVMNDPAASDNEAVRKVFGRSAFEASWRRASGGLAYVIRPADVPLPPRPPQPNW
jgi:hypothetical protein